MNMEKRNPNIFIDQQPIEGIGEFMASPKFADNQLDLIRNIQGKEISFDTTVTPDLPAIVTAERAEITATVEMTLEQAARIIDLISPYSRDFAEAFHETVKADPKRWHIYGHTKRARIRNKQYKSFVTELVCRIEAKAKAREDHATL